jgi:hypothetical protein
MPGRLGQLSTSRMPKRNPIHSHKIFNIGVPWLKGVIIDFADFFSSSSQADDGTLLLQLLDCLT